MITQNDLYSYSFKKEELTKSLASCSNKTLIEKYEQAIKVTDQAFEKYGQFYKSMQSVLNGLLAIYEKYENDHKEVLKIITDRHESLAEIERKSPKDDGNGVDKIISNLINSRKYLSISMESVEKLIDISLSNRETVKKIADDQAKLLKVILEATVDVLFLYIYRVDMADINSKVMKEFVNFVAGIIPFLGPFASGMSAIINSVKVRIANIKSADNVLNYLDNYIETVYIWSETTQGYIRVLDEWKDSF